MALTMDNIPIGYGTRRGTFADILDASPVPVYPEFARRLEPALYVMRVERDLDVGVGEIGRRRNPVKPGAAAPDHSFHEAHMGSTVPHAGGACAADMVRARPGLGHAVITDWSIVPAQARGEELCGLHSNVGDPQAGGTDEAWHWQPVEIDGFLSWRAAGSPAIPFRPFYDPREEVTDMARRIVDQRVLDTRTTTPFAAGETRPVKVGERTDLRGVVRIQVVDPQGGGYITINHPDPDGTSRVNYWPGLPVASDVAVIGLWEGVMNVTAHGAGCNVIVDVQELG